MCQCLISPYAVKLWIFHGTNTFSAASLHWCWEAMGHCYSFTVPLVVSMPRMFDSTLILNNHELSRGLRCSKWQNATHIAADRVNRALTSRDMHDSLFCQTTRFYSCIVGMTTMHSLFWQALPHTYKVSLLTKFIFFSLYNTRGLMFVPRREFRAHRFCFIYNILT